MIDKAKKRAVQRPGDARLVNDEGVARIIAQTSVRQLPSVEVHRLKACINLCLSALQSSVDDDDVPRMRRDVSRLRRTMTPRRALLLNELGRLHEHHRQPQGHTANNTFSKT